MMRRHARARPGTEAARDGVTVQPTARPDRKALDGAARCPHNGCGKRISITVRGYRRAHTDRAGRECPGGGVRVVDVARPVQPYQLPPVVLPGDRSRPNRQPSGAKNPAAPKRYHGTGPVCTDCGGHPRTKQDGSFVAHRTVHQDPTTPYCPGGAPRGRQ